MKKQTLTKKEIKKIKKKLKELYTSLDKFKSRKAKKEAVLLEQLELWDQQLRPYEAAFKKAKKKVRNRKKSIAALEKMLKKKKKKAKKEPSKSKQNGQSDNIPAPAKMIATNVKENDLKKIEGIGPKIEEILKHQGIRTFQTLAKTSVGKLSAILSAAGNRFKMHQPDTWPEQAKLAADGQWKALQDLQDKLDGGKKN